MKIRKEQTVCERMKVNPEKPNPESVIGLAIETLGKGIIHGLRHPSEKNSNGWFIWSGEYSEADNFFTPVCLQHIESYLGEKVFEYLNLPPGYRFLIDGNNYEDVWFDDKLLEI